MNGVEGFINVLLVIFIFWILYLATRQAVPEKVAKEHFFCPMAYHKYQLMRTYPQLKYRCAYY